MSHEKSEVSDTPVEAAFENIEVRKLPMTWIGTFSGAKIAFLNPDPAQIRIEDIARVLSRVNRFTGHTTDPYSVAQHSVLASRLVKSDAALHALMHDAAESYMGDCPRPLKEILGASWSVVEHRLNKAILTAFKMELWYPGEMFVVDDRLCKTEILAIHPNHPGWRINAEPYSPDEVPIVPWSAPLAEASFLERFRALFPSKSEHAG